MDVPKYAESWNIIFLIKNYLFAYFFYYFVNIAVATDN